MTAAEHPSLRVLVTGASGAVGPHVAAFLDRAGCAVRTLSRKAPAPGLLPPRVETRIGDITDRSRVRKAMEGIDAVIHLAALLQIPNPGPALTDAYERVNVGGTAVVAEAALEAGVGRLVHFSTIAVYGGSAGGMLTEGSPPRPASLYARTKLAAEKIVLAARRSDGLPLATVLRFGAIYGPGIQGNYRHLLLALARGRFIPIGPGDNRRTLIHVRDAARAAWVAARHPDAAGKTYNVMDGSCHRMQDIVQALCRALGRKPPRLSLPIGPVRWLAVLMEGGARSCGLRAPATRAMIDTYLEDVAVDGRLFCRETGFSPEYDLKAGWRETVAEMRRAGDL